MACARGTVPGIKKHITLLSKTRTLYEKSSI